MHESSLQRFFRHSSIAPGTNIFSRNFLEPIPKREKGPNRTKWIKKIKLLVILWFSCLTKSRVLKNSNWKFFRVDLLISVLGKAADYWKWKKKFFHRKKNSFQLCLPKACDVTQPWNTIHEYSLQRFLWHSSIGPNTKIFSRNFLEPIPKREKGQNSTKWIQK